jgi:secretion/DNA translocation related TadE-like protein
VLVAVFVVLLCAAALVLSVIGGLLVHQRRLESAADLAALAGAAAVQRGEDGCAAAGRVARRNGSRLAGCLIVQDRVEVTTAGRARLPFGAQARQQARARAGPAG